VIDIKRIEANPAAFDEAMKARGLTDYKHSSAYLLALYEMQKLDAQIEELENSVKKIDAKLFHKLKQASEIYDIQS
jgi:seryl-tRNA synthetase